MGPCPYCDHENWTPAAPAEMAGQCSRETCGGCGKRYWLKHSRIDPVAYPLEHFVVNEETRTLEAT